MHIAFIAMGGNLPSWAGESEATLAAAAQRLESLGGLVGRSSLYSTKPVGFADQPRFVNAVVSLETNMEPQNLLRRLLDIEQEFGRDRSAGIANGPRTLDLDILLFGDLVLDESELTIPHVRLAERAFVLVPLDEIAPKVVDPRSGKAVATLLKELVDSSEGEAGGVVRVQIDGWIRSQIPESGPGVPRFFPVR